MVPEGATLDRRARPARGMFPKSGLSRPPCSSLGLYFYPLLWAIGPGPTEPHHAVWGPSWHTRGFRELGWGWGFSARGPARPCIFSLHNLHPCWPPSSPGRNCGVRGSGGAWLRTGGPRQTQNQAVCWPVPQMKSVRSRVWSSCPPASCTRGGGEKTRQTAPGHVVRERPSGNRCLATTAQPRGTVTTA